MVELVVPIFLMQTQAVPIFLMQTQALVSRPSVRRIVEKFHFEIRLERLLDNVCRKFQEPTHLLYDADTEALDKIFKQEMTHEIYIHLCCK
jgi:hypothetical protein